MIRVDFMLKSWDLHSWVFGELFARIESVGMSLAMLIELYMGSWVWWTYEWWIYDVITSYDVEIG